MLEVISDFYFPRLLVLTIFWLALFRVGEKSISIPENDFLLSRG